MKQKLLLMLFTALISGAVNAQKGSVYAITGTQKGSNNWTEVRLVDVNSGQDLKTVFKYSEETQLLNARTGKPIVKKDQNADLQMTRITPGTKLTPGTPSVPLPENVRIIKREPGKDGDNVTITRDNTTRVYTITTDGSGTASVKTIRSAGEGDSKSPVATTVRTINVKDGNTENIVIEYNGQVIRMTRDGEIKTAPKALIEFKNAQSRTCIVNVNTDILYRPAIATDKPFATYSAACAYDKKHERLYYTPMGIAQLRYIDLKAKTPTVYYFEDEQFGALRGRGDVQNQITRMVMGADGNGYALTNNAEHLIRFTTDKKATITDLGGLSDDPSNGKFSVHSAGGYGGDIVASKSGDLFLITANHNVFQINIKDLTALYKGTIQGLPRGYSTNGAAVEEDGTTVIVNSSNSTEGYYHFDINKLEASKMDNSGEIFGASDLANANLLFAKKEKEEQQPVVTPVTQQQVVEIAPIKDKPVEQIPETRLSVYPNPVTNSVVNLVLENYAAGRYQAKLIDVSGKQLSTKGFTISNKVHTEPYNLPPSIAKGNYLIQLYDQTARGAGTVKLVVQ